jgi:hypothetical protein
VSGASVKNQQTLSIVSNFLPDLPDVRELDITAPLFEKDRSHKSIGLISDAQMAFSEEYQFSLHCDRWDSDEGIKIFRSALIRQFRRLTGLSRKNAFCSENVCVDGVSPSMGRS